MLKLVVMLPSQVLNFNFKFGFSLRELFLVACGVGESPDSEAVRTRNETYVLVGALGNTHALHELFDGLHEARPVETVLPLQVLNDVLSLLVLAFEAVGLQTDCNFDC